MYYTQYPDLENMELFLYMPLSTPQPVGAQPELSRPSAIDLHDARVLWQLELPIMLLQMHYTHYPDAENIGTWIRVPFNRWQHSRSHRAHWTTDPHDARFPWQLELTIILMKMHYTQYPDSENLVLFFIHDHGNKSLDISLCPSISNMTPT